MTMEISLGPSATYAVYNEQEMEKKQKNTLKLILCFAIALIGMKTAESASKMEVTANELNEE